MGANKTLLESLNPTFGRLTFRMGASRSLFDEERLMAPPAAGNPAPLSIAPSGEPPACKVQKKDEMPHVHLEAIRVPASADASLRIASPQLTRMERRTGLDRRELPGPCVRARRGWGTPGRPRHLRRALEWRRAA